MITPEAFSATLAVPRVPGYGTLHPDHEKEFWYHTEYESSIGGNEGIFSPESEGNSTGTGTQ